MGDPLLLPAIAIAAGILLGRLLGLSLADSAWPIGAFLILAVVGGLARRSAADRPIAIDGDRGVACGPGGPPPLGRICWVLAFIFMGAFAEAWHRPGLPPRIDAGSRETLILEGCVVEPTVFSPNREQFTLELEPRRAGARQPHAAGGRCCAAAGLRTARGNRRADPATA